MYARPTVNGKLLSFGVSGKLWKDALVMYDRETQSLWSHVTGQAIAGKLVGMRLQAVPALQMTWAEWKQLYPQSLVLSKSLAQRGATGTYNVYESYSKDETQLGIFGTKNPDEVLPGKEFVVGLTVEAEAAAYPFRALSRQPLVNDIVAGRPIVVTFSSAGATGAAFSRTVGTRTLTFVNLRRERGDLLMEDRETHTTWQALSGQAVRGSLAPARLVQLPSTLAFWFAWKGFHPQTRLWKPDTTAPAPPRP
ncbi:MAG: hypothetical protein A2Z31_01950 [candidate division NC10 bacterium RBG_16_65_8]|nr:MAG: hypothetical protein A2Z31_01950 [candidate division NC10 bacterium RBG_16_65_8]